MKGEHAMIGYGRTVMIGAAAAGLLALVTLGGCATKGAASNTSGAGSASATPTSSQSQPLTGFSKDRKSVV